MTKLNSDLATLTNRLVDALHAHGDRWITFRALAREISGDESLEHRTVRFADHFDHLHEGIDNGIWA
jgi:hypothetical protein